MKELKQKLNLIESQIRFLNRKEFHTVTKTIEYGTIVVKSDYTNNMN